MALKSETRELCGLRVTSTQLPVRYALPLLAELGKMLAVAFDGKSISLMDNVGRLLTLVDPATIVPLSRDILRETDVIVDGKRIELRNEDSIDRAFNGNLPALFKVLAFALEVNFGDFLDDGSSESPARSEAVAANE